MMFIHCKYPIHCCLCRCHMLLRAAHAHGSARAWLAISPDARIGAAAAVLEHERMRWPSSEHVDALACGRADALRRGRVKALTSGSAGKRTRWQASADTREDALASEQAPVRWQADATYAGMAADVLASTRSLESGRAGEVVSAQTRW